MFTYFVDIHYYSITTTTMAIYTSIIFIRINISYYRFSYLYYLLNKETKYVRITLTHH